MLGLVTGDGELDLAVKTTSNTALSYNSREGANPPQLVVNISSGQAAPTAPPTATPTAPPSPHGHCDAACHEYATPLPTGDPRYGTATPTPLPTATATAAPAATLTFIPVADAYVSDSAPTTNYGSALTLRVDSSAPVQRSYLRFDVQGVTAAVTRATLRVYANSASSAGYAAGSLAGSLDRNHRQQQHAAHHRQCGWQFRLLCRRRLDQHQRHEPRRRQRHARPGAAAPQCHRHRLQQS